ncbi:MAG: hemolysin III family protein [Acutalibacteraceae bacterium]|nr:hemolysin III family protein [Acutalibacteraceae bacterium]
MKRIKLKDRILPSYTKGEEIFNMVTHIVGGALAVIYLVVALLIGTFKGNPWAIVSGAIYGVSTVTLFAMSSVYHGLRSSVAKKVFQVLDHCTIYFMIAGTYTPITIGCMREKYPVLAWIIFGVVWGLAALGITLTAIDIKKHEKFAMMCYLVMGWCIVVPLRQTVDSIGVGGILWMLTGGILYTIGAVLYRIGVRKKYIHSVFHIFVDLASVAQFVGIVLYVL